MKKAGKTEVEKEKIDYLPSFWELKKEINKGFIYENTGERMRVSVLRKKYRDGKGVYIEVKKGDETRRFGYSKLVYLDFANANVDALKIMNELNEYADSIWKRIKVKVSGYDEPY